VADKKKSDRIGRIVWLTRFLISGQNFFCPPPYYAVWNHPYLIILSAFSFSQSFNFAIFFYQRTKWNQDFFWTPSTKKSIQFWCIFLIFRNSDITWQKTAFYQKNHFFKKSDLTTNIFMLVNLEPIFGFILEINSIPNYLHGHTVAAMCFNMGHLVKKVG